MNKCKECRASDHDDLGPTRLVVIRRIDDSRFQRERLCEEHIEMALLDGAEIKGED